MINKVIPALDGMNKTEVFEFLDKIGDNFEVVKIGMELFYKEGHSIVNEIHSKTGKKIFLDLKLYDIPNTVRGAIKSLSGLPIEFLTIHLSGGDEMIQGALEQAKQSLPTTKLLGVSYLTSLDDSYFHAIQDLKSDDISEAFKRLFDLAEKTSIHGIVCSPLELEQTKNYSFLKVCPGIRFQDEIEGGNLGDQKRVLSPKDAMGRGASYLVMGRSLRNHDLIQRLEQLKGFSN